MIPRSELHAARTARNRAARIRALAELMREYGSGPGEGLTETVARAAGFSQAEIEVYHDAALEILRSPSPVRVPPAREQAAGHDLVRQARAIRHRSDAR